MVSLEWISECAECETCVRCGNNIPKLHLVLNCDVCKCQEETLYQVDGKQVCKRCAIKNAIKYDQYDDDFQELIWTHWLKDIEEVDIDGCW